jgi:PGF-pre-PGF domain-containing protein
MKFTRERKKIDYNTKRGKLMKFMCFFILITILFTSLSFNCIAIEEENSIPLKNTIDKSVDTEGSTTDDSDDSTSNDDTSDKQVENDEKSEEEIDDISDNVNTIEKEKYIDYSVDWLNENYDETISNKSNNIENKNYVKNETKIEKNIGNISVGEKVIVESEKSEQVSIDSLEFISSTDLKDVKFSIERLEDIPEEIIEDPILNASVYVYLDIKLTSHDVYLHEEEFESIKFQFKVNKSWIYENNIDINSIQLFRYNNQWQPLLTIIIDEDDVYFYFEAESPGFSIYTVVGTEIVEGSQDIIINKSLIPINGWIAIIAIVTIMLLTIVYKFKFIYKEN